jgi:hypothetical protein
MDWFDHYLDGLSEGTNVVYPPDSNTWRPVKPTKQQQSFIQDSIISDMVRMRMIQEERAKLEENSNFAAFGGGGEGFVEEKTDIIAINLWEFNIQSGTSLNDVNLSFDQSATVQIDWGDNSVETINSNTNYNHAFN